MAGKTRKRSWLAEYKFDIILVFVVALGILILINPDHLQMLLIQAVHQIATLAAVVKSSLERTFINSKSSMINLGLVILGVVIVYWRLIYHLRRTPRWNVESCPRCNNSQLRRIHRTSFDRLLNSLTNLHLRRYRCPNCGWSGLSISETQPHQEEHDSSQTVVNK